MNTELLIVGSGPAGLNAAYKAASNGVKIMVIDQWFALGGKLKQQTQFYNHLPNHFSDQKGFQFIDYLVERLKEYNVTMLKNHTMIGAYQNGNVGITNGSNTFPVNAEKVLLTTGAMEEPVMFPGWTLPGVMTAGAAQLLINCDRVLPGERALILGSNDFALEVASELHDCGVQIKGVVERGSEVVCQNDDLLEKIQSAGIPLLLNSVIEGATGRGEVQEVCVRNDRGESIYNADLVCIAKGMTPVLEPFQIMSCDLTYQEKLGGWLPKYDSAFRTTNPFVYVAGNAAGVTGMSGVLLTGEIAAANILETLNVISTEKNEEEKQYLWDELYRIESMENSLALNARLEVIRDLHQETGDQLPTYMDSVLGGLFNG